MGVNANDMIYRCVGNYWIQIPPEVPLHQVIIDRRSRLPVQALFL